MKRWTTALVNVVEVPFDYEIHSFDVFTLDGKRLGGIYPSNIIDMKAMINALDNGQCPIADEWEDGEGNSCTLDGWGGHYAPYARNAAFVPQPNSRRALTLEG